MEWMSSPSGRSRPLVPRDELTSSASMLTNGRRQTKAFFDPEFSSKLVTVAPGITHVTPTPEPSNSLCNAWAKLRKRQTWPGHWN